MQNEIKTGIKSLSVTYHAYDDYVTYKVLFNSQFYNIEYYYNKMVFTLKIIDENKEELELEFNKLNDAILCLMEQLQIHHTEQLFRIKEIIHKMRTGDNKNAD